MFSIPLIHSGCLEPFLRRTILEGDWFDEELWSAGLPHALAEGAEFIIPFESAIKFVGRSARRLGADEFGLQVGATTSIRSLPRLGDSLERAVTLHDAINIIVSTLAKITTVRRVWLEVGATTARLNQAAPSISPSGEEHAEQFALMLLINLVREVAGKNWWPSTVVVSQSTYNLIGGRPDLLNCSDVVAGQFTSFTFDACLLWRDLSDRSSADRQPPTMSVSDDLLQVPSDFIGSLCAAIETNLRSGRVGLEPLTHAFGVSPRTLQRRIAASGLSYERLLGEARLRVARELLANPEIRIAEIALELGYEDAANFTRAFKRWTGIAPFDYRQRLFLAPSASD